MENNKINKMQALIQRFGHLAIVKNIQKLNPSIQDADMISEYLIKASEISLSETVEVLNPLEAKLREIQAYLISQNLVGFKNGYVNFITKNYVGLQKVIVDNFPKPFIDVYLEVITGDCINDESEFVQLKQEYLDFLNQGLRIHKAKLIDIARSFDSQVSDHLKTEFSSFDGLKEKDEIQIDPSLGKLFENYILSVNNSLLENELIAARQTASATISTFILTLRSPVMIVIGLSMIGGYIFRGASIPNLIINYLTNHPVLNISLICGLVSFALFKTLEANKQVKESIRFHRNNLATKIKENIIKKLNHHEMEIQTAISQHCQSFLQEQFDSVIEEKFKDFDKNILINQRQRAYDIGFKLADSRKIINDLNLLKQEATILMSI